MVNVYIVSIMLGARIHSSPYLLYSLTSSTQPPSQPYMKIQKTIMKVFTQKINSEYAVNISQVSSLEQLTLTRIIFILQPFHSISISVSLFDSVTKPSISF
jgi:hypothetical protein